MTTQTKAFPANVTISADDARTVVAVISTSDVDRDGEVLVPQGMRAKDYEKNPVVFYNHAYADFCAEPEDKLPIGKVTDLKRTDTEVIAKIKFAERPENYPAEKTWLPDTLFSLYQQGAINGWSVGFSPLERRPATDRDVQKYGANCRLVTSKWDLLELSAAPLQCNQEAVTIAVSKGLVSRDVAQRMFIESKVVDGAASLLTAEQVRKALGKGTRNGEPLARTYTQYVQNADSYNPTGDTKLEEKLAADAYRIQPTPWGIRFTKMRLQTDELYMFKNSVMEETLGEIDRFWDLKGDYEKLGLMHNRGIILYGPPGTGKTSIMNQTAEMIANRGDVVFYAKSIYALIEGMEAFREVESDRKAVVVLEDADEYLGYQERDFLQLLDGEKSVDGVLYLASTNYINRFPPRLLRPGRFDKRIYVGAPPYEGRLAYLSEKLKKVEKTPEIERLAKATDGLSFGDLRELVTATYALKEPADQVINRLKANATRKNAAFAASAKKSLADDAPAAPGQSSPDPAQVATEAEHSADMTADKPLADESVTDTHEHAEAAPVKRVVTAVEGLEPAPPPAPVAPPVKRVHRVLSVGAALAAGAGNEARVKKLVIREYHKARGRFYADD